MYCTNCGTENEADAKFCRSCGHQLARDAEAATEVSPRWPGADAAPTAVDPAGALAFPAIAAKPRPSWLIPAAAVASLIVAVAIVAVIVLASGGNSGSSFTAKANEILAPVVQADGALDAKLQAADRPDQLGPVAAAASSAHQEVVRAQGTATVLDVPGSQKAAKALLDQALAANLAYLDKVTSASSSLGGPRATAAATAAQQAAQSFTSLAAAEPKLTVPATSAFLSVNQLQALATAQEKQTAAKQAKAQSSAALRSYVRSIDGLLQNSAETRTNLGALIGDIQGNQITATEATSQISSIINQRQDLQNQVAAVPAPAPFRAVAEKLRSSIAAALADDYAIQGWISAWYDNDPYSFNRAYAKHEQATTTATTAKSAFLADYNRLRAKYLHLPPLDVSY